MYGKNRCQEKNFTNIDTTDKSDFYQSYLLVLLRIDSNGRASFKFSYSLQKIGLIYL